MPANWPPTSHFSCLFQGMVDALRSSGSSTRRACCLSDAQETGRAVLADRRASASLRIESKMTAGINYSVSRLHLNPTSQAVGEYIADTGERIKRRNTNLTETSTAGVNKQNGITLQNIDITHG